MHLKSTYAYWHDFSLRQVKSDYMDLPSGYEDSAYYCASLGHKINHSFYPNCKWSVSRHPVFGRVPAVVTIRSLPMGSELTCHYKIDMQAAAEDSQHMAWYLREWERTCNTARGKEPNENLVEGEEGANGGKFTRDEGNSGCSESEGQIIAESILYAIVKSIIR